MVDIQVLVFILLRTGLDLAMLLPLHFAHLSSPLPKIVLGLVPCLTVHCQEGLQAFILQMVVLPAFAREVQRPQHCWTYARALIT